MTCATPTAARTPTSTAGATAAEIDPNLADNTAIATTIVIAGAADLQEASVSASLTTVPIGGKLSVTDTATNRGGSAAAKTTTRYYLSGDAARDAGDLLLTGSRSVPALAAGASSTGTATVTVPNTAVPGTYFLLACADDGAVIPESNETNTCRAAGGVAQVTP